MKEKAIHLFTVPKEWSNEKIEELIEYLTKAIEKDKKGIIVRNEVKYDPLIIREGDELRIIRENDKLKVY